MQQERLIVAGDNLQGQCFLPGFPGAVPTAAPLAALPGGRRVAQTALGASFTLLLDSDGEVWAAGENRLGQLGRAHANNDRPQAERQPARGRVLPRLAQPDSRIMRRVAGFGGERVACIAAGNSHGAAVTEGGQLFAWGCNIDGQCGTGKIGFVPVFTATRCVAGALAEADVRVAFVACGGLHTVAVTTDGSVIVFGGNFCGQLGVGSSGSSRPAPEQLACAALVGVRIVGCAAGGNFTHLVSDDGHVFAIGQNDIGQLGTGDTSHVNTPTDIGAQHFGGKAVAAVAGGASHVLVLTVDGELFACGQGSKGATGLGHTAGALTPQRVAGAADVCVVRIAAGIRHSSALTHDGRVFAFGTGGGTPAAGAGGVPQLLLQGALADAAAAVRALGSGCSTGHSTFVPGAPPRAPGFDAPLTFPWFRRRTLLLCLLAVHAEPRAEGAPPPPPPQAAAAVDDDVLLRVAALPNGLWKGPCIFQYL